MSIIQTIRDRAAVIIFVIIAISLIAFILQDSLVGGSSSLMTPSTTVGKVNGKKLELTDFLQRVQANEAQYTQAGMQINDGMRQNIYENVWNQFITEKLLDEEINSAGIMVSDKELNDMFFGDNPAQELRQMFTNPQTGEFNGEQLKEAIRNLKAKKSDPQAKAFATEYLPQLIKSRMQEKYVSLINASAYVPKWMMEKMNTDNSSVANINFVSIPYGYISDSTIKVTDADISAYVAKHKAQYKQEKTRSIAYVGFNAAPSAQDSAEVLNQLTAVESEFITTSDVEGFLNRNSSEIPFLDAFVLNSKIQVPNADSIKQMAVGTTFGPYLDQNNYVIAKMLEKRSMPDSIKVRHILIKTTDMNAGVVRTDSAAKALIDSIAGAAKSGANFNELVLKYSEDDGSKNTAGEYEFASTASLVKPFYEVAFFEPVGTKKVVKAESQSYSGYHYIEVLQQKNFEQAYKVAYLARPILASTETETEANAKAAQFVSDSKSLKSFRENATKQNLQEYVASDITETAFTIPGVGTSRSFVKAIFAADKGDVLEQQMVGDKVIVAVVTEVNEEGVMSAAKARPLVESFVRNEKKAEAIIKKAGSAKSLDEIARVFGTQVQRADSISFASTFVQGAGSEPKLVGAAFNPDNAKQPTPLFSGIAGVYALQTLSLGARPSDFSPQQMMENMRMQMQQFASRSAFDALKKTASIEDNRSKVAY